MNMKNSTLMSADLDIDKDIKRTLIIKRKEKEYISIDL
jgi:hypothetical protein